MKNIQTGGHCGLFEIKNNSQIHNLLFTRAEMNFEQLPYSAFVVITTEQGLIIEAWQVKNLQRDLPKLINNNGENQRYYFRRLIKFSDKNVTKKLNSRNFKILSD